MLPRVTQQSLQKQRVLRQSTIQSLRKRLKSIRISRINRATDRDAAVKTIQISTMENRTVTAETNNTVATDQTTHIPIAHIIRAIREAEGTRAIIVRIVQTMVKIFVLEDHSEHTAVNSTLNIRTRIIDSM